jgi:hypothetical protein
METPQNARRAVSKETLKTIGLLAATTLALIGIYNWWFPDRPTFGVQVETERVAIPDNLFDDVNRYEEDVRNVRYGGGVPDEVKEKIDGIRRLDLSQYRSLNRHVTFSLTNTGNRPAKNVELQIGHKGYAVFTEKDEKKRQVGFVGRLAIQDLAARETVRLEWWDDADRFFGSKVVEICHDEGVQTVKLPQEYSGVADAFFSQTGIFGFLGIIVLVVIAIGILISFLSPTLRIGTAESPKESEPEDPSKQGVASN